MARSPKTTDLTIPVLGISTYNEVSVLMIKSCVLDLGCGLQKNCWNNPQNVVFITHT